MTSKLYVFVIVMVLVWPCLSKVSQKMEDTKCALVKECEEKAKNATKSCFGFMTFLNKKCQLSSTYCENYSKKLVKACTFGFCQDCLQKAGNAYEECIKFSQKVPNMANQSICATIKKDLHGKCPYICKGRGSTISNPGKNCKDILETDNVPSGIYWIKPDDDSNPVKAFCDMEYHGGGWTLASYGYVATSGYGQTDTRNKNIPNMNHPNGFNWHPTQRASSNGLIPLQHGAVNLVRGAHTMIMAAGNNPAKGGIDQYSHIYLIDISHNPYTITFANHNRYHGAIGTSTIPKMHVVQFNVTALKGEPMSSNTKRYALAEALGISWSDSYPTGYGFSPVNSPQPTWSQGPFFPSFHSGDGRGSACAGAQSYPPDVQRGCPNYVHNGWHSLNAMKNVGQTSIWFK